MSDAGPPYGAFLPFVGVTDANDEVLALVLTEPMINVMRNTPGLEALGNAAKPGDYAVGLEARVVPGEQFLAEYRQKT